ncbi:unnamed protein product [Paramecium octaurelia]|uniref:Uncharacterized protein n=1 Tax=Paramecium octaurelia TaxID=43137 RepID=A0A8S1XGV1_PAROT|nr:unnamed protein product [Paramecium octaurelia]
MLKQEDQYYAQQDQQENQREYEKTALSICELNYQLTQQENQNLQESRQQHNRIDVDFRKYLTSFSIIKKKDNNITQILKIFDRQCGDFDLILLNEGRDKKEYKKMLTKLQRIQKKAWNLNLDKREDIKQVCNAYEFPDKILDEIAQTIKNYNRE